MYHPKAEYRLDSDWFGGMNEGDLRRYKSNDLPVFYKLDAGVKKVIDFMLREIRWEDLRGVAEAIAIIAPSVFARLPYAEIRPILFRFGAEERCFCDHTEIDPNPVSPACSNKESP